MLLCDHDLEHIGLHTQASDDVYRSLFPCFPYVYVKKYGSGPKEGEKRQCGTHTWFTKWWYSGNVFDLADKDTKKREEIFAPPANYCGPYCYSIIQGDQEAFLTYSPCSKNPLPPPKNPQTMRMIVLDIDSPNVVPTLLGCKELVENSAVIWTGSTTKGRYHIHLMIDELPYEEASEHVKEWLVAVGINEKGVSKRPAIECNVTGLTRILLPGQIPANLPCVPGHPEQVLCRTYRETKQLFADTWEYQRKPLKDLLVIPETYWKAKDAAENAYVPYVSPFAEEDEEKEVKAKKRFVKRSKTNIPGLWQAFGSTVDGIRKDYCSLQECLDEADGFRISSGYIPAVLRACFGDVEKAHEIIMENRQSLRTADSKKHKYHVLKSHVTCSLNHFAESYDAKKRTKVDEAQNLEDGTAQIDFHIRKKRDIIEQCQGVIKDKKAYVIASKQYGLETYVAALRFIAWQVQGISKYNGRTSQRSEKERDEYTFADSKCMLDYPCFAGRERLLRKVLNLVKELGIFTDLDENGKKTCNNLLGKCSRWTVCKAILVKCGMRTQSEEGRKKEEAKKEEKKQGTSGMLPIGIIPYVKYSGTFSSDINDYGDCKPWPKAKYDAWLAKAIAEKEKRLDDVLTKEQRIEKTLQTMEQNAKSLAKYKEDMEWEGFMNLIRINKHDTIDYLSV